MKWCKLVWTTIKSRKIRRRGWSDSSPDIYPVRPSLTNKQPQKCSNCLMKNPATNQLSTGYWKTSSASNKPWIPPENKYQNKVGMEKMNDGWHDLTTRHNKSKQTSRKAAASNAQCNKKPSYFLQPSTVKVKRNQLRKSHITMLYIKK